jgi:hypothetical protein
MRVRSEWAVAGWSVAAAFGAYFCMYAFRKPFTAAGFEGVTLWGLEFKPLLVVAQTLGYCLSKFIGIKVVSEVSPAKRAGLLLGLIGAAWAALLLFAVTPPPWNIIWLFANGFPLGMVFGLVLGFLEGRRQSEALTAGLCCSFIVSDGVVKSVGAWLMAAGVSEYWMPFLAGMVFVLPLCVSTWMLARIPPPSAADVSARSERTTMTATDRWAMFRRYAVGLTLLSIVYLLVTVLRSVRSDFAPQIWEGLMGEKVPAETYSWSEIVVAAGVTGLMAMAVLLKDNRRAFYTALGVAMAGAVLLVVALMLWAGGLIGGFAFMVLCGVGLYLPYIAVHTVIFERLIALTRDRGTMGYLMYLVDSFGYLGYVLVLGWKVLFRPPGEFLPFFLPLAWVIAIVSVVLIVPCVWYFAVHPATRRRPTPEPLVGVPS